MDPVAGIEKMIDEAEEDADVQDDAAQGNLPENGGYYLLPDVALNLPPRDFVDADETLSDYGNVVALPAKSHEGGFSSTMFLVMGMGAALLLVVFGILVGVCVHYRRLKKREEDKILAATERMESAAQQAVSSGQHGKEKRRPPAQDYPDTDSTTDSTTITTASSTAGSPPFPTRADVQVGSNDTPFTDEFALYSNPSSPSSEAVSGESQQFEVYADGHGQATPASFEPYGQIGTSSSFTGSPQTPVSEEASWSLAEQSQGDFLQQEQQQQQHQDGPRRLSHPTTDPPAAFRATESRRLSNPTVDPVYNAAAFPPTWNRGQSDLILHTGQIKTAPGQRVWSHPTIHQPTYNDDFQQPGQRSSGGDGVSNDHTQVSTTRRFSVTDPASSSASQLMQSSRRLSDPATGTGTGDSSLHCGEGEGPRVSSLHHAYQHSENAEPTSILKMDKTFQSGSPNVSWSESVTEQKALNTAHQGLIPDASTDQVDAGYGANSVNHKKGCPYCVQTTDFQSCSSMEEEPYSIPIHGDERCISIPIQIEQSTALDSQTEVCSRNKHLPHTSFLICPHCKIHHYANEDTGPELAHSGVSVVNGGIGGSEENMTLNSRPTVAKASGNTNRCDSTTTQAEKCHGMNKGIHQLQQQGSLEKMSVSTTDGVKVIKKKSQEKTQRRASVVCPEGRKHSGHNVVTFKNPSTTDTKPAKDSSTPHQHSDKTHLSRTGSSGETPKKSIVGDSKQTKNSNPGKCSRKNEKGSAAEDINKETTLKHKSSKKVSVTKSSQKCETMASQHSTGNVTPTGNTGKVRHHSDCPRCETSVVPGPRNSSTTVASTCITTPSSSQYSSPEKISARRCPHCPSSSQPLKLLKYCPECNGCQSSYADLKAYFNDLGKTRGNLRHSVSCPSSLHERKRLEVNQKVCDVHRVHSSQSHKARKASFQEQILHTKGNSHRKNLASPRPVQVHHERHHYSCCSPDYAMSSHATSPRPAQAHHHHCYCVSLSSTMIEGGHSQNESPRANLTSPRLIQAEHSRHHYPYSPPMRSRSSSKCSAHRDSSRANLTSPRLIQVEHARHHYPYSPPMSSPTSSQYSAHQTLPKANLTSPRFIQAEHARHHYPYSPPVRSPSSYRCSIHQDSRRANLTSPRRIQTEHVRHHYPFSPPTRGTSPPKHPAHHHHHTPRGSLTSPRLIQADHVKYHYPHSPSPLRSAHSSQTSSNFGGQSPPQVNLTSPRLVQPEHTKHHYPCQDGKKEPKSVKNHHHNHHPAPDQTEKSKSKPASGSGVTSASVDKHPSPPNQTQQRKSKLVSKSGVKYVSVVDSHGKAGETAKCSQCSRSPSPSAQKASGSGPQQKKSCRLCDSQAESTHVQSMHRTFSDLAKQDPDNLPQPTYPYCMDRASPQCPACQASPHGPSLPATKHFPQASPAREASTIHVGINMKSPGQNLLNQICSTTSRVRGGASVRRPRSEKEQKHSVKVSELRKVFSKHGLSKPRFPEWPYYPFPTPPIPHRTVVVEEQGRAQKCPLCSPGAQGKKTLHENLVSQSSLSLTISPPYPACPNCQMSPVKKKARRMEPCSPPVRDSQCQSHQQQSAESWGPGRVARLRKVFSHHSTHHRRKPAYRKISHVSHSHDHKVATGSRIKVSRETTCGHTAAAKLCQLHHASERPDPVSTHQHYPYSLKDPKASDKIRHFNSQGQSKRRLPFPEYPYYPTRSVPVYPTRYVPRKKPTVVTHSASTVSVSSRQSRSGRTSDRKVKRKSSRASNAEQSVIACSACSQISKKGKGRSSRARSKSPNASESCDEREEQVAGWLKTFDCKY